MTGLLLHILKGPGEEIVGVAGGLLMKISIESEGSDAQPSRNALTEYFPDCDVKSVESWLFWPLLHE